MKKMEQVKATGFEVTTYQDCDEPHDVGRTISTHKNYQRVIESVKKAQNKNISAHAFAIIDGKTWAVIEVKGKIPADMITLDERYIDDDGVQYVRWEDGHYDPIQTVNSDGVMTSCYTSICVKM